MISGVIVWSATTSVDLRLSKVAAYDVAVKEWSSVFRKEFDAQTCSVQGVTMQTIETGDEIADLKYGNAQHITLDYTPLRYTAQIKVLGNITSTDIMVGGVVVEEVVATACSKAVVGVGECTLDCDGISEACIECDYACEQANGIWHGIECQVWEQLTNIDVVVEKSAAGYAFVSGFELTGANHESTTHFANSAHDCSADILAVNVTVRSR